MIIIKKIDRHEMERRFAIGEVNSGFFFAQDEERRKNTFQLLTSGNYIDERSGIQNHQITRGHFINSLPGDTDWYLAKLCMSEDEFRQLRTVNVDGWVKYTNNSLRLIDAAMFLEVNPQVDQRVSEIVEGCKQGHLETCGITLFGREIDGIFTVVEGTARLVSLYLTCVKQRTCPLNLETVEITLGLSQSKWNFS